MGYRSDVRLIMKKTSLETFKNANDEIEEIIEDADINKTYGILVYLGWDDIKGNTVDTISDALSEFSEEDLSYRLTIMGENLDDIEEDSYTSSKDEELYIPYPSIIRQFDESDLEFQMKYFLEDTEKSQNQKEDIDI